ncbi:MAG: FtsQ-type POTRA domain-containing protein [Alphaproteobacteria bacterium]|nr:FtsQ-type POTRA domain-containing protein [Alphaproteobacteria bacterium]
MMDKKTAKKYLIPPAVLLALYFISPYWQLHSLKSAIQDQDVVRLEKYIDWPSVKNGLKADMMAAYSEHVASEENDFAKGLALVLGPAVVNQIAENISASSLIAVVKHRMEENDWQKANLIVFKTSFTGLTEFSIWLGDDGKSRMVMAFENLHWIVKRIVFDEDAKKYMVEQNKGSAKQSEFSSSKKQAPTAPRHEAANIEDEVSSGKNIIRIHGKDSNGTYADSAYLNDRKIVENDHVDIYRVLPYKFWPNIVLIKDTCGGSSCWQSNITIVDLTVAPPVVVEGFCVASDSPNDESLKIKYESNAVRFDSKSCAKNKMGDLVSSTYIYDRKYHALYREADFDKSILAYANQHPDSLFNEQSSLRPALAKLLGDDFARARDTMGVSGGLTIKDGRYLMATGCVPHSCGNGGTIVIDITNKDMWVAWMHTDEVLHFRATRPLSPAANEEDKDINNLLIRGAEELHRINGPKVVWPNPRDNTQVSNFDSDDRAILRNIIIEGRVRTSNESLAQAIDLNAGIPMSLVNTGTIQTRISALPEVKSAFVEIRSPDTLVVHLTEKAVSEERLGFPDSLTNVIAESDWPFVRSAIAFAYSNGDQQYPVRWANSNTGERGTVIQIERNRRGCKQFSVVKTTPDSIVGYVEACSRP